MRCKTVRKKLNAYLDGELPAGVAVRVEEHVRGCPLCAEELAGLRRLGGVMDAAPRAETPEAFALSVLRAAARRARARESKIIPIRWLSPPLLARAAAVLALVFGVAVGGLMSGSVMGTRNSQMLASSERSAPDLSMDLLSAVPPDSMTETYLEWACDLE